MSSHAHFLLFLVFCLSFVGIDVLHALDLGVTQDLIGNVLWEWVTQFAPGRNLSEKVKSVALKLKEHYKVFHTPCRIDALSQEMIRQDGKSPKLRAKGAETKGVLPFALELAIAMKTARPTAHFDTVASCASCLMDFYILLDSDEWNHDAAAEACRRFCVLFHALSREAAARDPRHWKMKPKMHLFQELAEFQTAELGHPARYWTYQDESSVGVVAKMAMSRGGARSAASAAKATLLRSLALSS